MLAVICLVLFAIAPLPAAATIERSGLSPFLSFSAAGEGMGNAVGSMPADPTNIWINPGGLAFQQGWTIYLSPSDEVSDGQDNRRDRVFSLSRNLGRKNALGGALILRDQNTIGYRVGDGPIQVTDLLEQSFLLTFARRFGEGVGLGVTAISYQQTATEELFESDRTYAFTAGVLARFPFLYKNEFPMEMRTGVSVANMGPSFDVGTVQSDLPLHARLSASLNYDRDRLNGFTIGADVYSHLRDREVQVENDVIEVRDWLQRFGYGVGGELRISGVVALRAGYLQDDDIGTSGRSGGTFGFDVGHEIYRGVGGMFEYSRAPAATGDTADHIGIRLYIIPEYFGKE